MRVVLLTEQFGEQSIDLEFNREKNRVTATVMWFKVSVSIASAIRLAQSILQITKG